MVLLQPCTDARVACGPSVWVGPIIDSKGAAVSSVGVGVGVGRGVDPGDFGGLQRRGRT